MDTNQFRLDLSHANVVRGSTKTLTGCGRTWFALLGIWGSAVAILGAEGLWNAVGNAATFLKHDGKEA